MRTYSLVHQSMRRSGNNGWNLLAGTSRTPEHELRVVGGVVGDRERDVNKPRVRLEILNILGVKSGKKTKADNPPGRHEV